MLQAAIPCAADVSDVSVGHDICIWDYYLLKAGPLLWVGLERFN
jgi:hypothetical protein